MYLLKHVIADASDLTNAAPEALVAYLQNKVSGDVNQNSADVDNVINLEILYLNVDSPGSVKKIKDYLLQKPVLNKFESTLKHVLKEY